MTYISYSFKPGILCQIHVYDKKETQSLTFPDSREGLLELLSRYKFVLTIENAACDDYVTEKLWDALAAGAVPVYAGAPNIWSLVPNKKSIVAVDEFDGPVALAQYLEKVLGLDLTTH